MSAEEKLERLRELHQPVIKLRCGARTTKVVKHYSGSVGETELVCTKDPHPATEPHKDAICCWHFHEFVEGEPAPEDVWRGENCSCGRLNCPTRAILEEPELCGGCEWEKHNPSWIGVRAHTCGKAER